MSSVPKDEASMLEKALRTFEDLIRRSLAPSLAFVVIALTVNLLGAQISRRGVHQRLKDYMGFVEWAAGLKSSGLIIALTILLVIGLSYVLATVQQVLFDNLLKADFEPLRPLFNLWCRRRHKNPEEEARRELRALKNLRKEVVERIKKVHNLDHLFPPAALVCFTKVRPRALAIAIPKSYKAGPPPFTDYVLYEILGGIDPTPTRPFVDSAKAMGILFGSTILVLVGNGLFNQDFRTWGREVGLGVAAVFSYWMGFNVTATQYRARALRLYVNFLTMPIARIEYLLFKEERDPSSGETRSP